jgi:hypothetical protein
MYYQIVIWSILKLFILASSLLNYRGVSPRFLINAAVKKREKR